MKLRAPLILLTSLLSLWGSSSQAQESAIRKNLAERVPQLKAIDEVNKTAIPGLYEIRVNGTDIYYTDALANYLIQGSLIDTKARKNLTDERINKLTAVKFEALPMKDAFTIVRGNGSRKLAVFEDPNCGFCKRFERDLAKVDNVTIYLFLYPILGQDSSDKSRNVWCAKDPAAAWAQVMGEGRISNAPACDTSAIARNVEFGRKFKITGTPTLVAQDGARVPGAINTQQIEKLLADASK